MEESSSIVEVETVSSTLNSETEVEEQEKEYLVNTILDKRTRKGKVEYFLNWMGYPDVYNTWEPKENLDCKELIKEYEAKMKLKNKKTRTKKKPVHDRKQTLIDLATVSGTSDAGPSKECKKITPITQNADTGDKVDKTEHTFNKVNVDEEKSNTEDEDNSQNIEKEEKEVEESKEEDDTSIKDKDIFADFIGPPGMKFIPEKIIGSYETNGKLMLLLKWQGIDEADIVPAEFANNLCPQIVLMYYEALPLSACS